MSLRTSITSIYPRSDVNKISFFKSLAQELRRSAANDTLALHRSILSVKEAIYFHQIISSVGTLSLELNYNSKGFFQVILLIETEGCHGFLPSL